MGKALFQKRDRALRNVGRNISELRDAEVRLQTVRQLAEAGRADVEAHSDQWRRAVTFLFTEEFARDGRHPVHQLEATRL